MTRLHAAILLIGAVLAAPTLAAPAGPIIQGDPQAGAELGAAHAKFQAARTWRSRMSLQGRPVDVQASIEVRFRLL